MQYKIILTYSSADAFVDHEKIHAMLKTFVGGDGKITCGGSGGFWECCVDFDNEMNVFLEFFNINEKCSKLAYEFSLHVSLFISGNSGYSMDCNHKFQKKVEIIFAVKSGDHDFEILDVVKKYAVNYQMLKYGNIDPVMIRCTCYIEPKTFDEKKIFDELCEISRKWKIPRFNVLWSIQYVYGQICIE